MVMREISPYTATPNAMAGIERLISFGILDVPVCCILACSKLLIVNFSVLVAIA